MRVSYTAICTLAALAGLDLTHAALANPSPQAPAQELNSGQDNQKNDLAIIATDVQVVVVGAHDSTPVQELQHTVRNVIQTRAGGETSSSQLQGDVAAILDTGLFANARVNSRSTPAGLSVVYEVEAIGNRVDEFRHQGNSQTLDEDIKLPNTDKPREGKFGSSVTLEQPIDDDWQASLGLNYTRTSISGRDGKISPVDELGKPLSLSRTGIDDLNTLSFTATRDERDNSVNPTQGSVLSLSTEQSILGDRGNISMNQLQANYSQYVHVQLLGTKDSEVLAFNIQGGTTIGDLQPQEAFKLGGLDSVRGYEEGDVGSGRSYVLASAEYRFKLFNPLGAVVFADFASNLGSGEPGEVRGLPGSGFGYGAGVRLDSPIGVIRADFGINNQGESRLQLGIGQRF